jgi:hypothetical protein
MPGVCGRRGRIRAAFALSAFAIIGSLVSLTTLAAGGMYGNDAAFVDAFAVLDAEATHVMWVTLGFACMCAMLLFNTASKRRRNRAGVHVVMRSQAITNVAVLLLAAATGLLPDVDDPDDQTFRRYMRFVSVVANGALLWGIRALAASFRKCCVAGGCFGPRHSATVEGQDTNANTNAEGSATSDSDPEAEADRRSLVAPGERGRGRGRRRGRGHRSEEHSKAILEQLVMLNARIGTFLAFVMLAGTAGGDTRNSDIAWVAVSCVVLLIALFLGRRAVAFRRHLTREQSYIDTYNTLGIELHVFVVIIAACTISFLSARLGDPVYNADAPGRTYYIRGVFFFVGGFVVLRLLILKARVSLLQLCGCGVRAVRAMAPTEHTIRRCDRCLTCTNSFLQSLNILVRLFGGGGGSV